MSSASPLSVRFTAHPLFAPLTAALAVILLYVSGPPAYPLRLFTTLIHELAHGTAALLSGGEFSAFQIAPDGSGLAYTRGGISWLIVPAGYVGTALTAALLIRAGRRPQWSRPLMTAVGAVSTVLTLRFALPTLLTDPASGLLTLISGVGGGALLIWGARRLSETWAHWVLTLLGLWLAWSSLEDLLVLLALSTTYAGLQLRSDAVAMAELTGLPPVIWAVVWAALAVWLVGRALLGRLRTP
jgi:hypothetical protein